VVGGMRTKRGGLRRLQNDVGPSPISAMLATKQAEERGHRGDDHRGGPRSTHTPWPVPAIYETKYFARPTCLSRQSSSASRSSRVS
ncbi:hypothetical protein, partial [Bacillus siamensis]|uniref:hypothetical protein n=1 Tax=Bacillus siamensis TaxID=659243 RepID=UPI0039E0D523